MPKRSPSCTLSSDCISNISVTHIASCVLSFIWSPCHWAGGRKFHTVRWGLPLTSWILCRKWSLATQGSPKYIISASKPSDLLCWSSLRHIPALPVTESKPTGVPVCREGRCMWDQGRNSVCCQPDWLEMPPPPPLILLSCVAIVKYTTSST